MKSNLLKCKFNSYNRNVIKNIKNEKKRLIINSAADYDSRCVDRMR